ncbi:hypothetical protein [Streptomyces abyssalis]|nr:hypothetical protein [Streptomyces abyssalis]
MAGRSARTFVFAGFFGAMGIAGAVRTVAVGGRYLTALGQLGLGLLGTGLAAAWIVQYANRRGSRRGG